VALLTAAFTCCAIAVAAAAVAAGASINVGSAASSCRQCDHPGKRSANCGSTPGTVLHTWLVHRYSAGNAAGSRTIDVAVLSAAASGATADAAVTTAA
jgi:hypothetical protein